MIVLSVRTPALICLFLSSTPPSRSGVDDDERCSGGSPPVIGSRAAVSANPSLARRSGYCFPSELGRIEDATVASQGRSASTHRRETPHIWAIAGLAVVPQPAGGRDLAAQGQADRTGGTKRKAGAPAWRLNPARAPRPFVNQDGRNELQHITGLWRVPFTDHVQDPRLRSQPETLQAIDAAGEPQGGLPAPAERDCDALVVLPFTCWTASGSGTSSGSTAFSDPRSVCHSSLGRSVSQK
jgi:hypothetical protein